MAELFIPEKIRKLGRLKYFKTPSGSHVIVLPTCTVPLEHLVRENWRGSEETGNFRKVERITHAKIGALLMDSQGKSTTLYVKSPERKFRIDNSEPPEIWRSSWDQQNSMPYVTLENDTRIEKQSTWEARILLGLAQKEIKAEEPQAIVIYPSGKREVITKGIDESSKYFYPNRIRKLNDIVLKQGFIPEDLHRGNVIGDNADNPHIIDVNRWEWPPFTDKYRKRLMAAVEEEIKRQRKEKQTAK